MQTRLETLKKQFLLQFRSQNGNLLKFTWYVKYRYDKAFYRSSF